MEIPKDKFDKYRKEFDKLANNQGGQTLPFRLVEYSGKKLQLTEYCNLRYLEEHGGL